MSAIDRPLLTRNATYTRQHHM